jgi:hypothetical protein
MKDLILINVESHTHAVHSLASREPLAELVAEHGVFLSAWHNCINQQTCNSVEHRYPKTRPDLIIAVNTGRERKLQVRAVRSGHSFSNVAPTDGVFSDPQGMNNVLPVDVASLRDPGLESSLFSVESGITTKDLNITLDESNLALINMSVSWSNLSKRDLD